MKDKKKKPVHAEPTELKELEVKERESMKIRKCRDFWKEFILKSLDDREKLAIIDEVEPSRLLEIDGIVQSIMEVVLAIIVSQQKVIREDINSEIDERKTKETVLQALFGFNFYCASLMNCLWEQRKSASPAFTRVMTAWLSRQAQLVLQALTDMKKFLDLVEIHYSHHPAATGPAMTIAIVTRT